ncbi:MAG: hypothetical protein ACRD0P_29000, partial [Stackebrandtia sp.]
GDPRSAAPADQPPSGTRPGGGGAAPKTRAAVNGKPDRLRLVAPDEPPRLTPAAARALLALLLEAHDLSPTDHDAKEIGR